MPRARTSGLLARCWAKATARTAASESVFLLRDMTEEKRLAAERETARRKESLAEMATLLAHEIRNPLGSLELFAGLLADAAADTAGIAPLDGSRSSRAAHRFRRR